MWAPAPAHSLRRTQCVAPRKALTWRRWLPPRRPRPERALGELTSNAASPASCGGAYAAAPHDAAVGSTTAALSVATSERTHRVTVTARRYAPPRRDDVRGSARLRRGTGPARPRRRHRRRAHSVRPPRGLAPRTGEEEAPERAAGEGRRLRRPAGGVPRGVPTHHAVRGPRRRIVRAVAPRHPRPQAARRGAPASRGAEARGGPGDAHPYARRAAAPRRATGLAERGSRGGRGRRAPARGHRQSGAGPRRGAAARPSRRSDARRYRGPHGSLGRRDREALRTRAGAALGTSARARGRRRVTDDERADEIVGRCRRRIDAGEAVDTDAEIRAHPDLAAALTERFAALRLLSRAFARSARPADVPPALAGRVLGCYRLVSELGSGGMGTVFLASVEPGSTSLPAGAHVAVKVVHPHLA